MRHVRAMALAPLAALFLSAMPTMATATIFHGVDFPGGAASFADALVSYDPVIKSGEPTAPNRIPTEALGAPDYPEGSTIGYVSLGDGGSITLRFTDNSLTGSGSSALDLWIFEIGPDEEDTFVEISKDGVNWSSVGKVFGSTSGIDIDAFGFGTGDFFSFVRLTDDTNEGDQTGASVGADIDAVGAITTAPPVVVPEPGALAVIGLGVAGLGFARRRAHATSVRVAIG